MSSGAWFGVDEWLQTDVSWGTDAFSVGPRLSHGRLLLSQRVAGVGVGVFLLFFFLALSLVICLLGSRSKSRWLIYLGSTAMMGIVALVLLASPKGPKPAKPSQGYDQTVVPLIIIVALLALGILLGAVGMLVFAVLPAMYNRPLSYHLDIMEGRSS